MPPRITPDQLRSLRAQIKRLRRELARHTTGLADLLKQRGFRIYKREPVDDLLLPAPRHLTRYYRMMHKYSFRLFLRDVIARQERFTLDEVSRYASPAVTRTYIDFLRSVGLVKKTGTGFQLASGTITSFGTTLEWYVAELFRRELAAEAVWGVKFRRHNIGGDYDVITRLADLLVYVEVKSSPPKQIYDSEVTAFLDRVEDLGPQIAVFLMDTELRMKDKIVPMFEKELRKRYKTPATVERLERELFQVRDRVFIINAKESILQNMERVIHRYYQAISRLA